MMDNFQLIVKEKDDQILYLESQLEQLTTSVEEDKRSINSKIELLDSALREYQKKRRGTRDDLRESDMDILRTEVEGFKLQAEKNELEKK